MNSKSADLSNIETRVRIENVWRTSPNLDDSDRRLDCALRSLGVCILTFSCRIDVLSVLRA